MEVTPPDEMPEPPPLIDSTACVSFKDTDLDAWFALDHLTQDVVLSLESSDVHESHAALRHVHELDQGSFSVTVLMTQELRKHRGFTGWLPNAKATPPPPPAAGQRSQSVCALKFEAKAKHVHNLHFASFDLRVGGLQVRALIDTGANCSCMSAKYAKQLGLQHASTAANQDIGGVGGSVKILGVLTSPVKIQKFQREQRFNVVEHGIAGYDILLGKDFLRSNYGGIQYSPLNVSFSVGHAKIETPIVTIGRRLESSSEAHVDAAPVGSARVNMLRVGDAEHEGPLSTKQTERLLSEIESGKACGYRVIVTPTVSVTGVDSPVRQDNDALTSGVPSEVQEVIDKQSGLNVDGAFGFVALVFPYFQAWPMLKRFRNPNRGFSRTRWRTAEQVTW